MTTAAIVEPTVQDQADAEPHKQAGGEESPRFRWRQTWVSLGAILLGMLTVVLATWSTERAGACLLVGLAALACGGLIGFLFGVPHSTAQEPKAPSSPTAAPRDNTGAAAASATKSNTALQEISSWLTRLIVGAGLVNLRDVTGWIGVLGKDAGVLAGFAPEQARLFGASLILYFAVIGFLVFYAYARTVMTFLFALSDQAATQSPKS